MKLHQDIRIGRNTITGYGDHFVAINGQRHESAVILLPDRLIETWAGGGFAALVKADFGELATVCREARIDILLLGTGATQRFPQPALMRPLIEARIGVEVMDTHAACRTYNILMAEDRSVAAALLIA